MSLAGRLWRAWRDEDANARLLTPKPENPPAEPPSDPLDAYRPGPEGVWPEDRLTVSYAELRRLVALHLDQAWQGMPHSEPWAWVRARAAAMRDGETPLLLSEVLD